MAADPFFTTKGVGEGTGLVLSVIYGFAQQSRGHLRIDSQVGRGTTVTLYLPRASQNAVQLPTRAAPVPRGGGEVILVVEDYSTVRSILSEVLEDLGYTVLNSPDARIALSLLRSTAKILLLISEVVLPHINGRKLAETARGLRPCLKVLFVSGYAENARVRGNFLDHGMDMLSKPFSLDALAAKVSGMLAADDP